MRPRAASREHEPGQREAAGEGGAERERTGLHGGDQGQPGEQRHRGTGERQAGGWQRFDLPAQDAHRRHGERGEERRQGEEQRDAEPEAETAQHGERLELDLRQHRQERAGETGHEALEPEPEGDAGEAAGGGEQHGLAEVDRQDLARPGTQRLQHGDRVETAGEPGAHRLRHADPAYDQREQGDEAEKALGAVDAAAQLGLAFGGGLDAVEGGVGERAAQAGGERFDRAALEVPSGSFTSSRWLTRLPRATRPVERRLAPERKRRGPRLNALPSRSGSASTVPRRVKRLPPTAIGSPRRSPSRARSSGAATAPPSARSSASGRSGASCSVP